MASQSAIDLAAYVGEMIRFKDQDASPHWMPGRLIRIVGRNAVVKPGGGHQREESIPVERVRPWKKGAAIDDQREIRRKRVLPTSKPLPPDEPAVPLQKLDREALSLLSQLREAVALREAVRTQYAPAFAKRDALYHELDEAEKKATVAQASIDVEQANVEGIRARLEALVKGIS